MSGLASQENTALISASLSPASASLKAAAAALGPALQRVASSTPYVAENWDRQVLPVDTDRVQKLSPTTANENAVAYLNVLQKFRAEYPGSTTVFVFQTASQVRAKWLAGGELAEYECICCRETLTASAACVMNCCTHACTDDQECQNSRTDHSICEHLCRQNCDQVWCGTCLEQIIGAAIRSTLSFPPRPAFKPADTASNIHDGLQAEYVRCLYDWKPNAALSCHNVDCRRSFMNGPFPSCLVVLPPENCPHSVPCCRCGESTCIRCGKETHHGSACPREEVPTLLGLLAGALDWRRCAGCGMMVEAGGRRAKVK